MVEEVCTYSVSKEEPIAVYGGGPIGLEICRRLLKAGYNVVAIVDKNPAGVKDSPAAVYESEELFKQFGDIFIFISLRNAIIHTAVAKQLNRIGFSKILYIPAFIRGKRGSFMTRAWNTFFIGYYDTEIMGDKELHTVKASDYITSELGEFVTVMIHKDYIHTSTLNNDENNLYSTYYIANNAEITPHTRALADFPIDSPDVKNRLKRENYFSAEHYEFFNKTMFDLSDYYSECAPIVSFNKDKRVFNLIDGGHRILFLEEKGFTGIPLRVKRNEWEEYFKEREAQALMDYCREMDSLPFTVKHPAFIRFPVKEREADCNFVKLHKDLCR